MKSLITVLVAGLAGFVNLANCDYAAAADAAAADTLVSRGGSTMPGWDELPLASEDLWCAAQAKGAQMFATFWKTDIAAGRAYNPARQSANSVFRSNNIDSMMFDTWGWDRAPAKFEDAQYDTYGAGWLQAMRERGIGILPWSDICSYYFTHGAGDAKDEHGLRIPLNEQIYHAYGMEHRVTGASAKFGVQDKAGAIMIRVAESPRESFKRLYRRPAQEAELPQVRSLSDLLWAGWIRGSKPQERDNPDVRNLNYMFMMGIINQDTLKIMKRALHARGKSSFSVWPGDDFSCETPEGQALLGSPNGKPVGYFVNQRKADIGVKMVYNIRVFTGSYGNTPIMMFWLHALSPEQIQNQ